MGLLYSHYEANPVTNNTLKINAVSGTLTKTYKDSFFKRFEKGSDSEHFYFRENKPSRILKIFNKYRDFPIDYDESYNSYEYNLKEIVVLQVMLCADNNYLVEAIDKDKFDKYFEKEKLANEEIEELEKGDKQC